MRGRLLGAVLATVAAAAFMPASLAGDFRLIADSSEPTVAGSAEPRVSFMLLAQAENTQTFEAESAATPIAKDETPATLGPVEPTLSRASEPASKDEPTVAASSSPRPEAPRAPQRIDFSTLDADKRFEIAASAERSYRMLYFTQAGCKHCKPFDETTIPELVKNKWIVGPSAYCHLQVINGDEKTAEPMFDRFAVNSLPTLILISQDREVARIVGAKPKPDGYGRTFYVPWTAADLSKWMHANVPESERKAGSSGQAPRS